MASVLYQCIGLHHQVFQPGVILDTHYPAPRSVQIEVTIRVDLLFVHRDYNNGDVTEYYNDLATETLCFDLHLLENYVQAYEILGGMLTRLKIDPDSLKFDDIVDDIIVHGLSIGNCASNMGRMVLPLFADIWGMVEENVNDEMFLIRGALEESALATSYGMVPAAESSVKKMLKKVKVEGEGCVICLEEINGGSGASQMPCSHTFHGSCIEEWLKRSHYCPICRFEVPVSES